MRHNRVKRPALQLSFLAAGVLAVVLLGYAFGVRDMQAAGWSVVLVALYRVVPTAARALGWRALFRHETRPRLQICLLLRWINESVNVLLPVAQVGGHLVRTRLAIRLGSERAEAQATTIADFSIGMLTLLPFAFAGGTALFPARFPAVLTFAVGLVTAIAVVLAINLTPRARIFERLASVLLRPFGTRALALGTRHGAELDESLSSVCRDRAVLATSAFWHCASWVAQAGETWLILALIGAETSFSSALALESISAAARTAAFLVPAGVGVQEGTLVATAALLGIAPETAITLGIVKRFREVLVGVPGLFAWWTVERWSGQKWTRAV